MAMGKKKRRQQEDLWVATSELPRTAGHPFSKRPSQSQAQMRDGFSPTRAPQGDRISTRAERVCDPPHDAAHLHRTQ